MAIDSPPELIVPIEYKSNEDTPAVENATEKDGCALERGGSGRYPCTRWCGPSYRGDFF
jgi:hypothetical protein